LWETRVDLQYSMCSSGSVLSLFTLASQHPALSPQCHYTLYLKNAKRAKRIVVNKRISRSPDDYPIPQTHRPQGSALGCASSTNPCMAGASGSLVVQASPPAANYRACMAPGNPDSRPLVSPSTIRIDDRRQRAKLAASRLLVGVVLLSCPALGMAGAGACSCLVDDGERQCVWCVHVPRDLSPVGFSVNRRQALPHLLLLESI
jgi:hypothetical protein